MKRWDIETLMEKVQLSAMPNTTERIKDDEEYLANVRERIALVENALSDLKKAMNE